MALPAIPAAAAAQAGRTGAPRAARQTTRSLSQRFPLPDAFPPHSQKIGRLARAGGEGGRTPVRSLNLRPTSRYQTLSFSSVAADTGEPPPLFQPVRPRLDQPSSHQAPRRSSLMDPLPITRSPAWRIWFSRCWIVYAAIKLFLSS